MQRFGARFLKFRENFNQHFNLQPSKTAYFCLFLHFQNKNTRKQKYWLKFSQNIKKRPPERCIIHYF